MADAAQARSNDASRNDEIRLVKPDLSDLVIAAVSRPFTHINEPEIYLDQAFAMLQLTAGAWRDEACIGSAVNRQGLTHSSHLTDINGYFFAEALAGVATLVALAKHSVALLRHAQSEGR